MKILITQVELNRWIVEELPQLRLGATDSDDSATTPFIITFSLHSSAAALVTVRKVIHQVDVKASYQVELKQ